MRKHRKSRRLELIRYEFSVIGHRKESKDTRYIVQIILNTSHISIHTSIFSLGRTRERERERARARKSQKTKGQTLFQLHFKYNCIYLSLISYIMTFIKRMFVYLLSAAAMFCMVHSFSVSSSSSSSSSSSVVTGRTRRLQFYPHPSFRTSFYSRGNVHFMASAADDADVVEADIVVEQTQASSMIRRRQVASFRTASILYVAMALDCWKKRNDVSVFAGSISKVLSITPPVSLASGYLLAATSSYLLLHATEQNRLSSDTYKRLNLSLVLFSLLNASAFVVNWPFLGIAACLCNVNNAMVSFNGWRTGVSGLSVDKRELYSDAYLRELKYGVETNLGGLRICKSAEAVGYFIAFSLTAITIFHNVLVIPVLWSRSLPRINAIRVASTARLLLANAITYTLFDASNRKRLSGSTFINLNFALSAASMSSKFSMFAYDKLIFRASHTFGDLTESVCLAMLSPMYKGACVSKRIMKMALVIGTCSIYSGGIGLKYYLVKKKK